MQEAANNLRTLPSAAVNHDRTFGPRRRCEYVCKRRMGGSERIPHGVRVAIGQRNHVSGGKDSLWQGIKTRCEGEC